MCAFLVCALLVNLSTGWAQEEDSDEVVAPRGGRSSLLSRWTGDGGADLAIARGATVGAEGYFALGSATGEQSPSGGVLFFLYPTGAASHLRAKAGIPLYHNSSVSLVDRKLPDIYVSLEHEWGMKYFGISAGLAYEYMQSFDLDSLYNDASREADRYHFDEGHAVSMLMTLRAGKPSGGFVGHLGWPLPFTVYGKEPRNVALEYSALGVFGIRMVKFGIGIAGWYKHREPGYIVDRSLGADSTLSFEEDRPGFWSSETSYWDYVDEGYREFSTMFPVFRSALLFGKHLVVGARLELGGILFPRFGEDSDGWWKPSGGIDFTYSFGELRGPSVMDGTF
jgi:hypothetical protein